MASALILFVSVSIFIPKTTIKASASPEPPVFEGEVINAEPSIVTGSSSFAVSQSTVSVPPLPFSTYTIQSGDTLGGIAANYNISLDSLIESNNLTSDDIQPGDKLVVPSEDGIVYTVKSGNSINSIVSDLSGSLDKTIAINGLQGKTLAAGQQILVVDGSKPSSSNFLAPSKDSGFSAPAASSSDLILPVHGLVTQGLHYFNAIDIANNCGTPVHAAQSGVVNTVKTSGWNGGYGNYILLKNGSISTRYAHLEKIFVSAGQEVGQGDEIGLMGETGNATGCHLHFEAIGAANPAAAYPVGSSL